MDLLTASLCLAIDLARSVDDLASWWHQHQAILKQLGADELAVVIARKDRRRREMARLQQVVTAA